MSAPRNEYTAWKSSPTTIRLRVLLGQQLQQPVLGAVRVLILVDQHPAEDPSVLLADIAEQLEQVDGADQQVVEVHRACLDHPPLVEAVDVGDRLLERVSRPTSP